MTPWLAILFALGCAPAGPQTYVVSGTVTFNDQPVVEGDILFFPANRSLAPDAGKIRNGTFSARAKQGTCRVEVTALDVGPDTQIVMGSPIASNFIPAAYNLDSILAAEVSATADNVYEFRLSSDPSQWK